MEGAGVGRFLFFPRGSCAALLEHNPRPSSALDHTEFLFYTEILSTSSSGSVGLARAGLSEGFSHFLHLSSLPLGTHPEPGRCLWGLPSFGIAASSSLPALEPWICVLEGPARPITATRPSPGRSWTWISAVKFWGGEFGELGQCHPRSPGLCLPSRDPRIPSGIAPALPPRPLCLPPALLPLYWGRGL